jgi:hypothetical protein
MFNLISKNKSSLRLLEQNFLNKTKLSFNLIKNGSKFSFVIILY